MLAARRPPHVVAIAFVWCGACAIFIAAFVTNWSAVWLSLGVPSMSPPFADLRTITGGVHTRSLGLDPLVTNPGDPWHRPMNYPRVWLAIFAGFGIDQSTVVFVGLGFSVIFLLCLTRLLVDARTRVELWTLVSTGFSLATLFAMERGNTDLVIFGLVFVGLATRTLAIALSLTTMAAVLKLFPIAAFVALVWQGRGATRMRAIVPAVLGTAAVIALQARDIVAIGRGTPQSATWSYGVLSMQVAIEKIAERLGLATTTATWLGAFSILFMWLAAIAVALYVSRAAWHVPSEAADGRSADLFLGFGTIYVLTFLVGSNWTYRLIFAIPTLPFVFGLAAAMPTLRRGAAAYIGLCILALNVDRLGRGMLPLGHVAKAALALSVLVGVVGILRTRRRDNPGRRGTMSAGPMTNLLGPPRMG